MTPTPPDKPESREAFEREYAIVMGWEMSEIWPKVFVIGYGENARASAFHPAQQIRNGLFDKRQSIKCQVMGCIEIGYDGNLKKQLEKANKFKADYAIIIKDNDNCAIKNMRDGSQRDMPIAYLYDEFGRIMEERFYL